MSKELDYRISNISRAVLSTPWLCHEGKLEEMRAFLELRASGGVLDEEVVKKAFLPAVGHELFYNEEGERVDVDGIRYIKLFGVMAPKMNLMSALSGGASTQSITKDFRRAFADSEVNKIILHVDSPGGAATLIPELGQLIRENRGKKEVIVIAEGMMASGALWVGTAGTRVYASPSTDVGSQGAYAILSEQTKADEAAGMTYEVVRAGEFKALANPHEKLSEKAIAEVQRGIDEIDQMFVAELALNRNVSEQYVLERFGRGKVFSAKEAVDRKMIDGVMVFEELLDRERHANSSATTISMGGNSMKVTQKVKAALYSRECIDAMETSDQECVAFLKGAFRDAFTEAQGDEAKVLALIESGLSRHSNDTGACGKQGSNCGVGETTTGIDAKGEEYTASIIDPDRHITREQAAAEARARAAEISLAANELSIPKEVELEAHRSDKSIDEVREQFKEFAAKDQGSVGIQFGDAAADKVTKAVVGTLLSRGGQNSLVESDEKQYGRDLEEMSMMEIARVALKSAGVQVTGRRQVDAANFLRLGDIPMGAAYARRIDSGSGGSANRSGDHPDALSNMMGRILHSGYEQASVTYQTYTQMGPELPDRRPKMWMDAGLFQELDAMGEDQKHEQLKLNSQPKAMIMPDKYGNKVALTTEMIMDDDLGVFQRQIATLSSAAANTVDNACRALLASNPTMFEDDTPLFHSSHGNLVSAGSGAPSAAQAATHRTLHRMIKGYDSTIPMNVTPNTSFHPAAQEEAVLQTFLSNRQDVKVAQTDANINTVRGTLTPVMDPMLDAYSTAQWYTIVDKYKPLMLSFVRGMGGLEGLRTTWVDPDTGSRYTAITFWFGLSPVEWRGIVRNDG